MKHKGRQEATTLPTMKGYPALNHKLPTKCGNPVVHRKGHLALSLGLLVIRLQRPDLEAAAATVGRVEPLAIILQRPDLGAPSADACTVEPLVIRLQRPDLGAHRCTCSQSSAVGYQPTAS